MDQAVGSYNSCGQLNTDMTAQNSGIAINTHYGMIVSENSNYIACGVYHFDVMISLNVDVKPGEHILSLPKTPDRRLDALMQATDKAYFITAAKGQIYFTPNGQAIPAGTYKLSTTIFI